ncbi:uncharacterized protein HMPREF1120_04708 [Exophiala dermatitidis NIH/UT8656]|uniref:Uncharacterized protein n=1 Tax=Exophiala dermatitidis (strain ATCC 34100 / CBS 525.76 / NIH/UT8656) TaxID=858893 RepID=H6BY11_EXODN|nr:uncharacterized protein HMPREF1120_04708 [Exophiala dermatitidis NIH/UT8656]EHY56633.1 hypothetical protein HMPREF1120_04708 [Exophiala dermatitidis NIH/UT8656]
MGAERRLEGSREEISTPAQADSNSAMAFTSHGIVARWRPTWRSGLGVVNLSSEMQMLPAVACGFVGEDWLTRVIDFCAWRPEQGTRHIKLQGTARDRAVQQTPAALAAGHQQLEPEIAKISEQRLQQHEARLVRGVSPTSSTSNPLFP